MTDRQVLEALDDALGRCRHMPPRDAMREAVHIVYTAILAEEKEEAEKKMPVDEAIAYLTPIYESVRLDGYKAALGAVLDAARAQQGAEEDGPRYAERLRVFDDPWTGRLMTTCSNCQGKVGLYDKFCKHCGREFKEAGK